MSTLTGTVFECVYGLFSVSSDEALIQKMTWIGFWYTVVVGAYSYFFPAPYGRYSSSVFGPTINAKIAWMVQESPVVFMVILLYLFTPSALAQHRANVIPVVFLVAHYVNRSFIYPLRLSSEAKPAPLSTAVSAFIFCTFNGLLQGHHLLNTQKIDNDIFVTIGSLLFVFGMAGNIYHDELLTGLRKNSSPSKKKSYHIPRGGLFNLVSGANFFCEIVEWWGLALITRQWPQIVFAAFGTFFLGQRARHHHAFYQKTFGNAYPANRKAVVPFLI